MSNDHGIGVLFVWPLHRVFRHSIYLDCVFLYREWDNRDKSIGSFFPQVSQWKKQVAVRYVPVWDDECCLYNKFSGTLIGIRRWRGALIGDGALIEKSVCCPGRLLEYDGGGGANWRRGAYWIQGANSNFYGNQAPFCVWHFSLLFSFFHRTFLIVRKWMNCLDYKFSSLNQQEFQYSGWGYQVSLLLADRPLQMVWTQEYQLFVLCDRTGESSLPVVGDWRFDYQSDRHLQNLLGL